MFGACQRGGRRRRDQLPAGARGTRRTGCCGWRPSVGCRFAIDTDAHAPGQLDWLGNGTVRAEQAGITADRVINTRGADEVASAGPGASR